MYSLTCMIMTGKKKKKKKKEEEEEEEISFVNLVLVFVTACTCSVALFDYTLSFCLSIFFFSPGICLILLCGGGI